MNGALLRHTWRMQRTRLATVSIGLAAWGFLPPVIYARFGSQFSALMNSGMLPQQFARDNVGFIGHHAVVHLEGRDDGPPRARWKLCAR